MSTLITGCASGIGRHLARALAAQGHQVVATDVDETGLARAAEADGWTAIERRGLDVRDAAAWERLLDGLPPVELLLNVAGVLRPGEIVDTGDGDVDFHVDVNVKGVMHGTRAAARRMVARGAGHIVNFGSLASLAPVPGLSLYSASKFAVRGFSLAVAQELAPRGVAVTVILPDAVDTPMLDLQVDHDAAALTFSGTRPLTVAEIEEALVDEILPDRPLELALPRSRGVLARLATALPSSAMWLRPVLTRIGRKRQDARRRQR